ncbi:major capsid protein [Proteus mirabilis]|uniref:major capsid protein n=1 Tax=Proteus mirabilis TaxID=584 RepID=UPI00224797C8|nr:major capsid protein [Proteus mirabilis]EKV9970501.1 hypothetical protein [Proteus mirabilis]MCW9742256.1 major capsid protein [Proteus mirabilis]HEI8499893.1 hypothetical protein [Proteus mirabilis]
MSLYIFQKQVSLAATELVAQAVRQFNEASGGALVIGDGDHIGDYIEQTSWQLLGGLAQRRNAYGSGNLTPQELGQILDRMIKIDGRIGPVSVTPTMMKRLGKDVSEAAAVVAAQSAEAMLQDYLNTTGAALKAAISGNKTAVTVGGETPSLRGLNKATRPFGDAYSRIVAWLMDGATFNDFMDETLTNANNLFQIGNVAIKQDNLGRRFVISDIPVLSDADKQHSLGLVTGAAAVQTSPLIMKAQDVLGQENIKALMQGEYDFTIGLRGYQWSKDSIKSPTNEQIAAVANWKQIATDIKDTAGVMVSFGKDTSVGG